MNKLILVRWLLFIPMRLVDLLVFALSFAILPYFWYKIRGKAGEYLKLSPKGSLDAIIAQGKLDPVDEHLIVRNETHCLLQQSGNGLLNPDRREKLLEQVMYPSGTLHRRYPDDENHMGPSGDGISSWVFSYILWNMKRPDLVKRLAKHYLKNCFGLWWNSGNGVSARSSNGGVSVVVDGYPVGESWYKGSWGIMQPSTGPGYFTGAALFALAAKELGGIWKLIYAAHYLLLGGWCFNVVPVLHLKNDTFYYVHHITALNAWSLQKLRGGYQGVLKYLAEDIAPSGNAQPTICGLAWNAGAISNAKHNQAVATLLTVEGYHSWPQHAPLDPFFFTCEADNTTKASMAALSAVLLKAPANTSPEDLMKYL